ADAPPPQADRSSADRLEPEAGPPHLRLAGSDEPGQADDLPRPDGERDVVDEGPRRQALYLEQRLARAVVDSGEERLDPAARHQLDELLGRGIPHGEGLDAAAVPKDGHAVADPVELVHAV